MAWMKGTGMLKRKRRAPRLMLVVPLFLVFLLSLVGLAVIEKAFSESKVASAKSLLFFPKEGEITFNENYRKRLDEEVSDRGIYVIEGLRAVPNFFRSAEQPLRQDISLSTFLTLRSVTYLWEIIRRWQGPFSCVIYVPMTNLYSLQLREIYAQLASKNVTAVVHFMIDERPVSGIEQPFVISALQHVARTAAQTDLVLTVDPLAVPTMELQSILREALRVPKIKSQLDFERGAIVFSSKLPSSSSSSDSVEVVDEELRRLHKMFLRDAPSRMWHGDPYATYALISKRDGHLPSMIQDRDFEDDDYVKMLESYGYILCEVGNAVASGSLYSSDRLPPPVLRLKRSGFAMVDPDGKTERAELHASTGQKSQRRPHSLFFPKGYPVVMATSRSSRNSSRRSRIARDGLVYFTGEIFLTRAIPLTSQWYAFPNAMKAKTRAERQSITAALALRSAAELDYLKKFAVAWDGGGSCAVLLRTLEEMNHIGKFVLQHADVFRNWSFHFVIEVTKEVDTRLGRKVPSNLTTLQLVAMRAVDSVYTFNVETGMIPSHGLGSELRELIIDTEWGTGIRDFKKLLMIPSFWYTKQAMEGYIGNLPASKESLNRGFQASRLCETSTVNNSEVLDLQVVDPHVFFSRSCGDNPFRISLKKLYRGQFMVANEHGLVPLALTEAAVNGYEREVELLILSHAGFQFYALSCGFVVHVPDPISEKVSRVQDTMEEIAIVNQMCKSLYKNSERYPFEDIFEAYNIL